MDNSRNAKKRSMEKDNSIESKHSRTALSNNSTSSEKPKGSQKTRARSSSDQNTLPSTSDAKNQSHKNSLEMELDTDENLPRNFQEIKTHLKLPGHNNHDDDIDSDESDDDSSNEDEDSEDSEDSDSESNDSEENSSDENNDDNDDDDDNEYRRRFEESEESEDSEEDEDDENENDENEGDNTTDYKSQLMCAPHVTAKDHLLGTIAIALKHHINYKAILGLLEVLKLICNVNNLPTTKNALWKTLSHGDASVIEHYYCNECREYVGKKISGKFEKQCSCAKLRPEIWQFNLKYFFEINLSSQLKQLFSIPKIYESLQYRFNRIKKQNDALEDIYDGAEYRQLCSDGNFLNDQNNFSLTFNTGACKVFNSSNMFAWPIYVQINELPPHIRKKYMLLAGIYVDHKPPNINDLFLPFMNEIKKLYNDGIVWKPSEGVEITSKFIAVICSVDSVTRANILHMNQCDQDYGCIYCYAEGHKLPRGKYVYPVSQSYGRLRTHSEVINDMLQAYNTNTKVNGIQKISSLTALPSFDICKGVVVESMDAIFLGVAKQHLKILMKTSNAPYYIGSDKNRSLIDKILLNIKLPSSCSRPPRSISKWNLWKAYEWKNWLGHAPTCLEGIINVKYTKHLSLLSEAIDILNGDYMTQQRLTRADNLLKKYVKLFEQYFGIQNMSYNIHLLTHITDTVRNWGPICNYSRFSFESWNNKLINVVKRPHKRIIEMITYFLMHKFFANTVFDSSIASGTKGFIQDMLKISNIEIENQPNVIIAGKSVERAPTNTEKLLLSKENYQPQVISCYNEIKINGIEFQTQTADETKFCNSIIANEMKNYGKIVNIISFQHDNQKVFKIFMQQFRHIKYAFNTQYISQVKLTDNIVCVSRIENITPAVKISIDKNIYIYKLSSCWETN